MDLRLLPKFCLIHLPDKGRSAIFRCMCNFVFKKRLMCFLCQSLKQATKCERCRVDKRDPLAIGKRLSINDRENKKGEPPSFLFLCIPYFEMQGEKIELRSSSSVESAAALAKSSSAAAGTDSTPKFETDDLGNIIRKTPHKMERNTRLDFIFQKNSCL